MRKIMVLVLSVLLSSMVVVSGQEDDLQELPFFLTFVPNVQFSPLYVAEVNGYFAEEGYDLAIQHGDEPVGVDLIASGELGYGMVSGEQVIMARAGGRDVVYVYEWFQRYPVGIVVPNTTEAETVADLAGLKVGIPGRFGASYSALTALLMANNMTEQDIILEIIGYVAADVVCTGGVDASVIYVNNEPLQIQQRIAAGECDDITDVSVIAVADYVDMVSNGVVTSAEQIEENPQQVQAVVRAFDRGLRATLENPALAYLVSLDYVENLPIDEAFRQALIDAAAAQAEFLAGSPTHGEIVQSRADLMEALSAEFSDEMLIQFRILLASIDLWDAEHLGFTEPESWDVTLDTLSMLEMLPGEVNLTDAFTNDFLPPMAVTAEE